MRALAASVAVVVTMAACANGDGPADGSATTAGTIVVATTESTPRHVSLVGAGWSFGMCGGYCIADLAIAGERLVLTGREHMSDEPLFVNRGALTAAGLDRMGRALASLSGVTLDPVYGCPDCADGGAAYVVVARDGGLTSRHDVEFGRPPDALAEVYELAMSLVGALEACTSGVLVEVTDDCEARRR